MNNEVNVEMHRYLVTYTVAAGGPERSVEVDAIDAIDAKHVAEFLDGEVIVEATARKVRSPR